jgi:hypothetical protein
MELMEGSFIDNCTEMSQVSQVGKKTFFVHSVFFVKKKHKKKLFCSVSIVKKDKKEAFL